VIDASVGEIFLEQVEDSIHDLDVALLGGLPDPVVDNVSGMINDIDVGMSVADTTQSIFNSDPWSVASLN
jgi:hypothetical protein